MNLKELQDNYKAKLENISKENRSLTNAEVKELEGLKNQIEAAKNEDALAKKKTDNEALLRSIRESQDTINTKLSDCDANTYFRSITKNSTNSNNEVTSLIVRAYEEMSPLYANHKNIQTINNGNTFCFSKISMDSPSSGYIKTEGVAGRSDTTTTVTEQQVTFNTYSSEKITISTERMDDTAYDIAQEMAALGMAKSVQKFGEDCFTALNTMSATETAASGNLAMTDVIGAYYSIPARNRFEVKYTCNPTMAKKVIDLLDADDAAKSSIVNLSGSNLIVDDLAADNTLYVGNPTRLLAIGRKEPVRVFVDEVSEGRTIECQPRLAVALRDETAGVKLHLKNT